MLSSKTVQYDAIVNELLKYCSNNLNEKYKDKSLRRYFINYIMFLSGETFTDVIIQIKIGKVSKLFPDVSKYSCEVKKEDLVKSLYYSV